MDTKDDRDLRWMTLAVGGSFVGHLVPGLGYLICGLRYFSQYVYEQTLYQRQPYVPRALHARADVAVWLSATIIGICGEWDNGNFMDSREWSAARGGYLLYAQADEDSAGKSGLMHTNFNNVQHILLYSTFAIVAIAAFLESIWPRYVPRNTGVFMLILAFAVDSFQWYVHSIAKPPVHCMQHMLFAGLNLASAVTLCLELATKNRAFLALRSLCVVMTAVWFLAMATLMKSGGIPIDMFRFNTDTGQYWDYNSDNDLMDPGQMMMLMASLFSFLLVCVVIGGCLVYMVVRAVLVRCGTVVQDSLDYQRVDGQLVDIELQEDIRQNEHDTPKSDLDR
eukprot:TRINITY_DN3980_c0_g2_i1.p1 TRINITY_DN3980_c0_g2~~TRINITY_DN3980_c0_g2_i1.p1  ORF type:complete len:337 (-),score=56.65 TRINITY_DN3980_c0_g2_i1:175-1185(-)